MKAVKKTGRTIVHETREDAIKQDRHFLKDSDRDRIAKLAYELYQKRGCTHGDDLADWFEAEKSVGKGTSKAQK